MRLSGARVTVVGLGGSGLSAARLLVREGAAVTINDARTRDQISAQQPERLRDAEALGVTLDLGGHDAARLAQSALVVVSPGVPKLAALETVEDAGIEVIAEIELAARLFKGAATLIGVTGTNGKSTVTTLIGEMCKATGRPTFVGGNLGDPLCDAVGSEADAPDGYIVAELSSFQLERIRDFRAHVGVLLNVTDDHLDRYAGLSDYAATKGRLFATQQPDDFAIVPSDDPVCQSVARGAPGRLLTFGGVDGAVRRDGDQIVDADSGLAVPVAELGIRGEHNLGNAAAAALAAKVAGVAPALIDRVLRSFPGLPHRMQHIAKIGGIDFYDDSKATNVGAAVAALHGFARQKVGVVLIAGGKDKGGSYAPLREALERSGAGLVLIGEATELIARAFEGSPLPIARAADMREAVRAAHKLARWGEAVLLAPACASFDMYRSYAHRGEVFRAAVQALQAVVGP